MSYKNLSEEARKGLSRGDMKNHKARSFKPMSNTKKFFKWVCIRLYLIVYGLVIIIGVIGVVGVYFDWLKL